MKNSIFLKLFRLWFSFQTELFEIKRWSKYVERNKELRIQSVLHHEYSVTSVVDIILPLLKKYNPGLDELLIIRAFLIHDQPEGFSKSLFDCLVTMKTQEKDVEEYFLFKENYKNFPKLIYEVKEYAYLLQYALKENNLFPEDARKIMSNIAKNNLLEAKLFLALESWEYIFYAYEGYKNHRDDYILTQVLRRQIPHLQKMSEDIKGFKKVIFQRSFEKWCSDFINSHTHIPFE